MNPLFNQMNGNVFGNSELLQKAQQLKQQMGGGDPNRYIQQMLNSGKITQSQYNQAVQRVQELQKMFGQ